MSIPVFHGKGSRRERGDVAIGTRARPAPSGGWHGSYKGSLTGSQKGTGIAAMGRSDRFRVRAACRPPHTTFERCRGYRRCRRYCETLGNPYLPRSNYQPYSRLQISVVTLTPHMTSEIRLTIPAATLTPHMTSEIRPTIPATTFTWDWPRFSRTAGARFSRTAGARFWATRSLQTCLRTKLSRRIEGAS